MELSYDDHGSGDPVVLVHGHPFDRSLWRPQAAHLRARGFRVIVPDLRGYGASPVLPGVTTLTDFAEDLAELLDRLGVERFALGGLSMGGQIVLECHRRFPHRIRALLLADTFAEAETTEGRADRNAQADRLLREGMAGYAEEVLPKMVAAQATPEVRAHVLAMMRAAPPEGAAAALRGRAERIDYRPLLPTIAVPTLVVVGSADEFTPLRDARTIAEGIPGAALTVVEGAGHLPNLERPAEFNAALDGLLAATQLA